MANITSQIKRNRQSVVRTVRNKAIRSELKTYARRFRAAVDEGDRDTAAEAFRGAARKYDKAVARGVMHANAAANKKSRMAAQLTAL